MTNNIEINGCAVESSVVDGKTRYSYFACTCSEENEEFWSNTLKEHVESETLTASGLIMELEHVFNCYVSGIGADMWFGISLNTENETLYIQCDIVEYGLLAAILILQEVYPNE